MTILLRLVFKICRPLAPFFAWLLKWRWWLGGALFAGLVLCKLHGFSLESWNKTVKDVTPAYNYPTVGINRTIRSDEYAVSVPLVMAQCLHSNYFPRINNKCNGYDMDMFVATPPSPVWNWTVIGQAANWGYFMFGIERGLAWNWWMRYLIGFLFALEFFLIWLPGDKPLALVAAIAVTLGAPTQWWTTTVPYLNLFFFATLVFLYYLYKWPCVKLKLAAGVGFVVSLTSFVFIFYPPFQYLYGVALVCLAIDFVLLALRGSARKQYRTAWIILVVALLFFAAEIFCFLSLHGETLNRIATSSYPGSRISTGGNLAMYLEFMSWKIVSLLTPHVPITYQNSCRISAFFVPMAAMSLCIIHVRKSLFKSEKPTVVLLVWALMLFSWMLFPWPEKIAKAFLFTRVPIQRATVVAGFVSLLIFIKIAHLVFKKRLACSKIATLVGLLCSYVALAMAIKGNSQFRSYVLSNKLHVGVVILCIGIILLGLLTIAIMRGKRRLFLWSLLIIYLITGSRVNPISRGISPLYDKELTKTVNSVEEEYGEGLWLCSNSFVAQFLIANGFRCLNGVQLTANKELWQRVDPKMEYATTWNRYAHVFASIAEPYKCNASLLHNRGDCIIWSLDEGAIRALGVDYLLWSDKKIHEPWAEYLGRSRLHFVYKVRDKQSVAQDNEKEHLE